MNIELHKERQIDETEDFRAFTIDIDYLIEFLNNCTVLFNNSGRIITFFSKEGIYTLGTELIESSTQTLRSIKLCCSFGRFSDANTLIRKLRDDLIQFVYILNIIGIRKPFTEESTKELKFNNSEEFVNSILNLNFNDTLSDDEKAVTAWFDNSVSDLQNTIKKKLGIDNYMKVLRQNDKINQILNDYNLQEYWEGLRRRLNNYVHNNGSNYSKHNIISANDKNLSTHLNNINIRTTYISSFFLVLILMIDSSLFSSTDYIDHLECDLQPPEDSQYFIANFIQEFIDNKIPKMHPELKQYLKDNNIHGMKID